MPDPNPSSGRRKDKVMVLGPPKKRLLLLFLLLSFSIFAIHLLFFNSSDVTRSRSETLLPEHTLQPNHQNAPPFTFLIKVLTFNRLHALSRCLRSLASADYAGATGRVHLHVFVDHFPLSRNDTPVEESLQGARSILKFVDGFDWQFGDKFVHYRTDNAGLQAQWLEGWWPSSDHEFAFVVEDDLEVSPLYFKFLRNVILNYYYDASNFSPFIYGASLQRPRFVPGKHGNKIHLDEGTRLFLYQLVGTWGQLLFPKPWKEFRLWYDEHKAKGIRPILDGMVTTGWYKRMGERIWTPWFIKFIHSRGYFNIYTNFRQERALSVSHRDAGVNYGKTVGPDSQLLDQSSLDFNLMGMQTLKNLKWFDFCFREVFPGRVATNLNELGTLLSSVQNQETVLYVSLFGASEMITRNMLCHFEKLDTRNHIFLGPSSDLLSDLSRRGYPIIDAGQFLVNAGAYNLLKSQNAYLDSMEEILANAYAIKACLGRGQSCLIGNSNMLLNSNNFNRSFVDSTHDFYAGSGSKLMFVRHSSNTEKLWTNDLIRKIADAAEKVSATKGSGDFVNIMSGLLDQKGIKIKRLDEFNLADGNMGDLNQVLTVGTGVVYWSSEMGLDVVQQQLGKLDTWIINDDYSCKAVVCHRS